MNIKQAEAIQRLMSNKDWPLFAEVLNERIHKWHLDTEWTTDLPPIQGAIKELRAILKLDKKAESVIATGKAR
jgi:hypothetical protein